MLFELFKKVISSLGINMTQPIFGNVPIAIRFDIGDNNIDVYEDDEECRVNPDYISVCTNRALQIYNALGNAPDLLVIDGYLCESDSEKEFISSVMTATDLPKPDEVYSEKAEDEMIHVFLLWRLKDFCPDKILKEIIMADHGGFGFLASSVYFVCTMDNVLFHLYDDRGADLVAYKKEKISHVYRKFNHFILDYDRKRTDDIFNSEVIQ